MLLFTRKKLCFLLLLSFTACVHKESTEKDAGILKQTDITFSNLSRQKGMQAAFLQYMDDGGVLLRANHYPIVGGDARALLQSQKADGITLTWQPQYAEIAASHDLGYTYGLYTLQAPDTTMQGTYVTIWKKQKDGSWKFVLDTGNLGLGKK